MRKKSMLNRIIFGYVTGILISCAAQTVCAQYTTTVSIISGAPGQQITGKLEKNSGALLTELNNAQGEGRNLSLGKIEMDKNAASSLMTMWEICPFRCDELEIAERCLKTSSGGYQVRNIPVIMEPRKGERFEEDKYQEIVLNFDATGRVTDLCFALKKTQYEQIMRTGLEVTDLRRRAMVIEFVEQFRTAYNRKDIKYLEDIFSDDALIITGKVIQRKSVEGAGFGPNTDVEYDVTDKKTYLNKLSGVFQRNDRINVLFEDIKVSSRGGKQSNIYGVKLVQHWNTSSYSDKGYLFLVWDFKDENKPVIHVRTWQPFENTPKEKVFELSNFPEIK
jgi:hypothetical protein